MEIRRGLTTACVVGDRLGIHDYTGIPSTPSPSVAPFDGMASPAADLGILQDSRSDSAVMSATCPTSDELHIPRTVRDTDVSRAIYT